jgi:hypothetical protein
VTSTWPWSAKEDEAGAGGEEGDVTAGRLPRVGGRETPLSEVLDRTGEG